MPEGGPACDEADTKGSVQQPFRASLTSETHSLLSTPSWRGSSSPNYYFRARNHGSCFAGRCQLLLSTPGLQSSLSLGWGLGPEGSLLPGS